MIFICSKCEHRFDDEFRTTICPHETFAANDGNNNFAHHLESVLEPAFNEQLVSDAVKLLKEFAEERGLGAPTRVLFHQSAGWAGMFGVGCEWPNEVRNAVRMKGDTAEHDYVEALRRLRAWQGEAAQ